ncbi:SCP-like extracellular [Acetonema longum DSM 6540]|uniref:SCP-like extracellular n=1 Tax=Acetonema longum DSM 6540 TaxID=1009370 RepID=F7NIK9_9FIRM|nr:SCP-like extracellular [Acetonema longum DSM 6540]
MKKEVAIGLATLGLVAILAGHKDKKEDKQTTPGGTAGNNGSGQSAVSSAAAEKKALQLLNADRQANGLPALALNGTLTALARDYAQDMIDRNFFSHYNPEGQSPFDRMKQYGVSYVHAGENLAINSTVEGAEKAFMSSSGHRANILNPNYTHVGLGVRYNSKGSAYVVQEFIGK